MTCAITAFLPLPCSLVFFVPRLPFRFPSASVCVAMLCVTSLSSFWPFLFSRFVWRAEQVFIVETLRNVRHACSSALHNPVRHIVSLIFSKCTYRDAIVPRGHNTAFSLFYVFRSCHCNLIFEGMLFDFSFSSLRHLFCGREECEFSSSCWLDSSGTTGKNLRRFGYPPLICGRAMQRSAFGFGATTKLRFA